MLFNRLNHSIPGWLGLLLV